MFKILLFFIILFFTGSVCFAQHLSVSEQKTLEKEEDSMKLIAPKILSGRNPEERFTADSEFTKIFVRALQTKNSFYYPFDSLITIAKVTPPDSTFRIFTWQLAINGDVIRQHGAIQMRTADGSLKLFPLIDKSDQILNINDTITSNLAWIGALYYNIVEEKSFGKNYYTLLGFDDNNLSSDRKIIEILTFKDGRPVFGGPYFSFQDNSLHQKSMARYVMEYKKNAGPRLNYDKGMKIIIYEHLISETGEPKKKYTYIPDGDYEGLRWKDGKWVHIEKVFNQITPLGKEPVPDPILDSKGNIDESKLSKRMPENMDVPDKVSDSSEVKLPYVNNPPF
jgi:hypothetical protein